MKIRVLELFAGIGACSSALTRLGIEHEIVDAVEIDKFAIKSFNAIHRTNFEPQDITKWDKDIKVDLIMHGSPCQDFSAAGKQAGGDKDSGTRSSLMYETLRIVNKLKPNYVVWENVKNLLSPKHKHNFDNYLKAMQDIGYTNYYKVLNAKDYGVPQNRERIFTVSILNKITNSFEFPPKQELKIRLKDILENNVKEKYFLKNAQLERMIKTNYESSKFENRVRDEDGIAPTLCARDYKDPKCVATRIGGIFDKENKKHQAGSIWDIEGISPTLDTMQGGYHQPCVIVCAAMRGRYNKDGQIQQNLEIQKNETTNAITTVSKDNLIIESSVKPSVAKNFENEKAEILKSDKDIYQAKCTSGFNDNKIGLKISPTIRSGSSAIYGLTNEMIVRKLTPRECWRLMDFTDDEFNRAAEVNSNSQLYKQARKFYSC